MMKYAALAVSLFTALAYARTNLVGCTSSASGTRLLWWVPGTGEICDIPFCGMDPDTPITTSPGCPGYKGTATTTPSYMPGWGPNGFTGSPTSSSPMAVMTGASSKMDSATVTTSTMTKASGSSAGTLTTMTTTPAAVLSTVSTSTSTGTAPVVKSSGTTKASNGTVTTRSASASASPSQVSASGAAVGFSVGNVLGTIVWVAAAAAALL